MKQEIIIALQVNDNATEGEIEEITAGVWEELNRVIKESYPNITLIDVESLPRGRGAVIL